MSDPSCLVLVPTLVTTVKTMKAPGHAGGPSGILLTTSKDSISLHSIPECRGSVGSG